MIHLFVIAGVSLTATGISWWNGQRTEAVQEQIRFLEEQLGALYEADAKQRHTLLVSYVENLDALVNQELDTRNAVATELTASHAKARAVLAKRLGSRERCFSSSRS